MRFSLFALLIAVPAARGQVDFSRDVLPILSEHCFHCHGPDEASRKGRLRLDTKDGAYREKNGIAAVVPGKLHDSELYRRVTSTDADELMPPPDANRKLSAQQIATLKSWIESGAKWGRHWAFEPVRTQFTQQSIDGFIRERLTKAGLKPAPPASREAWLRRVTFDLTGLPPTIAELDAFAQDTSPKAFETVVDRLLASPRYGERMAADWLDVARFADTHGYQADRERPVWAYRDWVIKAFNRNLSYDRFVTEQLAGDLLPKPSQDQILATAFNRLHMQNEEGGIVEEEFRVAYVNDRVTTFGTAFLGLTLECSRCHDHKYDPITQKDFYSLFGFFQNIDESGQTSYFTPATPVPALMLITLEQEAKREKLIEQVRQKEAVILALQDAVKADQAKWTRPKSLTIPGLIAHYSFDSLDEKQSGKPHDKPKLVPGKVGQAVMLTGENGFTFPGVGHITKHDPYSIAMWLKPGDHAPRAVVLHHSRAPIDAGSRGYELLLEHGRVAFGLHHMWPGNSLKVRTTNAVPINDWSHVTITHDGSAKAGGLSIYLNGIRQTLEIIRDDLQKDITYDGGEPDLALGYRFRDNGFKNGSVDELKLFSRCLTTIEAKQLAGIESNDATELEAYYRSAIHEKSIASLAKLTAARKALAAFVNPIPEIMVMRELPQPKPAFILKRGQYDSPGEPVSLTTPNWLNPYPGDQPKNRLGLSRWLLAQENPLVARVEVNRLWQQMFGTGLVETSDNFGTQGARPTNPELLDWLATDFRRDWDIQRVLKMIALSETYRQSSQASVEAIAQDPSNLWLSRAPVRKLSAEMLRDQALFASSLLVEKIGGPSVKPYQPDGLWELTMGRPQYVQSKGDNLHRRSLYTFVKRTAPHPQMQTFDAADRSNCSVRRQSTSTPLQALALLNDPQIIEAARALAQRTPDLAALFRTITSRFATDGELIIINSLFAKQKTTFSADPKRAERFLKVGEVTIKTDMPIDLAARTVVVLTLLNHDDAVNCR